MGSSPYPSRSTSDDSQTARPALPGGQAVAQEPSIPSHPKTNGDKMDDRSSAHYKARQQASSLASRNAKPAIPVQKPAQSPATSSQESSTSSSADQFWPSLIVLVVVGLGAWAFYKGLKEGLTTKKCTRCGIRNRERGLFCSACLTTMHEEARHASAQREAQERARAAERQHQREQREEEARRRLRTLEELHRLSGTPFEELIASLFKRDGYVVRHCGGSGDEGIDLILEFDQSKDVVQCKRWKSDIGSPVVRDFYGAMMHAAARHGFILTTASFSPSACAFAQGKPITLVSGADILRWIDGAYSTRDDGRRRPHPPRSEETNGFDPYAVLGVSRNASKEEIREAYRREMTHYHPDKVSHLGTELQELAKRKAQAINRAYQELTNRGLAHPFDRV